MAENEKYHFSPYFIPLFLLVGLIYGCAAMKSPEGGPRDETPPKVLKMTPENLTTNFKEKKVTIEFDEYIRLNNEFKEFSISPELEKAPELKVRLKRLEINFTDTLEANTTYTLNFGKAIVDINESNELKNFTYVFSTGPVLDSLSISGKVTNVLTANPEIEATVFILPLNRDSIFGQKRPAIFTLTDSSGNFKLNNLKKDTYKIYALKETGGGDRIYQQISDEIGFIKEPIVLDKNVDSLHIRLFKEKAPSFRIIDKMLNADGSIFMSFNQQLKKPEIKVIEPSEIDQDKLYQFNLTNDSVKLWLNDLSFDSIKVTIRDGEKILDTTRFTRGKRDTYERVINITDNLEGSTLNPHKDLSITFNLPIKNIDESKILLLEDSIPRKFTLVKDTANILRYYIQYKWRPKEPYILVLNENATTGIFDVKNQELKRSFTLGDVNDYGTLSLTIVPPDTAKNYILQVINNEKNVVYTHLITQKTVVKLANYKQGIYFARIIYDENKNNVWDTGNVKEGIQPEKIWYEPKELSIRANWDREEIIKIPPISEEVNKVPTTDTEPNNSDTEIR